MTKGERSLEIHNPTIYPLIGYGTQGAVFKLSEDQCVKVYAEEEQAKMEAFALESGQHLPFFPKFYESGSNYVVMEYFNAPTLKEYLINSTYIPESIVKKLLNILNELKRANFTMIDAPLRHIFVLKNGEMKVIDHVNSFKRQHPVPLKLLRDLKMILLKDSFLSQVKKLDPVTFNEWDTYMHDKIDFDQVMVTSGGKGNRVKVDSTIMQMFMGKGHQGAVFRISEDQCIKFYGKTRYAQLEQEVLLSNQSLSFIPRVYKTATNYTIMEYLIGPDLNSYLKKQQSLSEDITRQLLDILKKMKQSGFKQIDAPLRHVFITKDGFKMIDHVYSYSHDQAQPLELFENLRERNFLDSFLEQVKVMDPETYKEWKESPSSHPQIDMSHNVIFIVNIW
ncbi:hypothetical protein [Sporolactobacillus shoreae]|uniref:hypothetical protein n=1 Tax=Sporolactobacillus shoreae TaxID=1465501 RepID=UPI001F501E32|nr:hypothetical protein [Sporolactobacillus shoreae]